MEGNKENANREDKNKWNLFIYYGIFKLFYNMLWRNRIKMKNENSIRSVWDVTKESKNWSMGQMRETKEIWTQKLRK